MTRNIGIINCDSWEGKQTIKQLKKKNKTAGSYDFIFVEESAHEGKPCKYLASLLNHNTSGGNQRTSKNL